MKEINKISEGKLVFVRSKISQALTDSAASRVDHVTIVGMILMYQLPSNRCCQASIIEIEKVQKKLRS
ncbi:predicted protein [Sclerotinia sclerotiorum 1980 UF-70]|uniref:Uncharacterized protein n=1 Tax=Sclerotinia sclerotiorum (strain ATCC 18683 / 1980 / Ss-1) TaxID=665079 RepID=A7ES24_SCLS1|nr:predicted protein [Sclerotinia sclerotiorum 1980 UF-70]EDN92266.1 predicted protein [Sclerotinia sclerotiorum 1980 UF-70]